MVFSSHLFIYYFLPVALLLYYAVPGRAKLYVLTVLSYIFYGWANPVFVVLLLFSTTVDFWAGLIISQQWHSKQPMQSLQKGGVRNRAQRWALALSLFSNLSLLGFFKYFNFGIDSVNAISAMTGLKDMPLDVGLSVILPLGISFYTFQSMSYSIDVYRGNAPAKRQFIDFACYVSLFPQLVAGPIIRYREVADQLDQRSHSLEKFSRGVTFFSLGLAKKVLLANPCGKIADTIFDAAVVGTLDAWIGIFSYSFQIYFDFSAYSDMAIGLGLMLGFVFPKNFDAPYRATSITDFWHRWHISLSTWLRDYLYIPLGGNRLGPSRTYINLMVVMLLGGLWHGAAWNFVLWGLVHGLLLAGERAMGGRALYHYFPSFMQVAFTFVIVSLVWVLFRAPDLSSAIDMYAALLGLQQPSINAGLLSGIYTKPFYCFAFLAAAGLAWKGLQTWDWTRTLSLSKVGITGLLLILSLSLLNVQVYNPFIYFIF